MYKAGGNGCCYHAEGRSNRSMPLDWVDNTASRCKPGDRYRIIVVDGAMHVAMNGTELGAFRRDHPEHNVPALDGEWLPCVELAHENDVVRLVRHSAM